MLSVCYSFFPNQLMVVAVFNFHSFFGFILQLFHIFSWFSQSLSIFFFSIHVYICLFFYIFRFLFVEQIHLGFRYILCTNRNLVRCPLSRMNNSTDYVSKQKKTKHTICVMCLLNRRAVFCVTFHTSHRMKIKI